ncbi:hypothetical protein AB0H58_07155 [Nocardia neocaledoniensis]|uniref:DUF6881 domain-containing protein n=1 Tax=Nocardia neocaledoniensis TaxID=236511 RepID=UPI0033DA3D2C
MSTSDRPLGDSVIVLQQALLQDIAADLIGSTQEEWHRIDAAFVMVGDRAFFRLRFDAGDGEFSAPSIPARLPDSLRQLKELMYVPGRGAWLTLYCSVLADGSFETSFGYDERPEVGEDIYRDLVKELELYPRTTVPEWITLELGDDLPSAYTSDFDGQDTRGASRVRVDSGLGPSDLYRPQMDRTSAVRLAEGFVPEEPDIEYFSVAQRYVSERDPVMVFLELGDGRIEYRKVEVFPNGCLDSASITSEGEYTSSNEDPWPATSELLQKEGIIAVAQIAPEQFEAEWLIANGS